MLIIYYNFEMAFDAGVNLCSSQFNGYLDTMMEHSNSDIDVNHEYENTIVTKPKLNGLISISNSQQEWRKNIGHTKKYSTNNFKVYTTIGIHPHNATSVNSNDVFTELHTLVRENPTNVVAVGECGLDYDRITKFNPGSSKEEIDKIKEKQKEVFKKQIEIANEFNKPLYMHDRDASHDMYPILKEAKERYPNLKGIIHCFTGKVTYMKKYIELGFYIGITGWICDEKRNKDLVEAVKNLPLNKVILETDAPWLIPKDYAKKWNTRRNQPDAIYYVSYHLAYYMNVDEDELIEKATENTKILFNI